jgi:hypothetical protein
MLGKKSKTILFSSESWKGDFALRSAKLVLSTVVALTLSAATSFAQSGSFKGFEGAWTGAGTVSLSDGSTERIRCRASYRTDAEGDHLKQTLRCASDSYKFDLSSDVTSQAGTLTGTWGEASRNINGNLQGRAGAGRISVFVEAAGFAANLAIVTRAARQTVTISSQGEIRGVLITLVKG